MTVDEAQQVLAQIYHLSVIGAFTTEQINEELDLSLTSEEVTFYTDAFEAPLRLSNKYTPTTGE